MEHPHCTPPRRSTPRQPIDESAWLAAMLTPVRGRRSSAAATSSANTVAAAADFRDKDNENSTESSAGIVERMSVVSALKCLALMALLTSASAGTRSVLSPECITSWSNVNNVCPLCRAPFTSIVLADGALHRVLVRPRIIAELLDIVTDADINNVRTFILRESESRSGDNTEALGLSEEARRSFHVAYWGVIAAANRNALYEVKERLNQLRQRQGEVCERYREVRDQMNQMFDDLEERADDFLRLALLRLLELNEVHSDDTWLFNEAQEIINGQQQVKILTDRIKDEQDQIRDELNRINDDYDQIDYVQNQIINFVGAVDRFDSASRLPTLANLSPSLRSAVQLLDDEHLFDLTRQMMSNLWG